MAQQLWMEKKTKKKNRDMIWKQNKWQLPWFIKSCDKGNVYIHGPARHAHFREGHGRIKSGVPSPEPLFCHVRGQM